MTTLVARIGKGIREEITCMLGLKIGSEGRHGAMSCRKDNDVSKSISVEKHRHA